MSLAFGAFLAFLDATIVNVAFPSIRESFPGTSIARLSWVLNAYNIVFAAFLIVVGINMIKEAFEVHTADVGHLPLHQQALAWGVSKKVKLVQMADNYMPFKWITVSK